MTTKETIERIVEEFSENGGCFAVREQPDRPPHPESANNWLRTAFTTIAETARNEGAEAQREKDLQEFDKLAYDTAVEYAAQFADETEWKQPYAGNRMLHLGWKIGEAIKTAIRSTPLV